MRYVIMGDAPLAVTRDDVRRPRRRAVNPDNEHLARNVPTSQHLAGNRDANVMFRKFTTHRRAISGDLIRCSRSSFPGRMTKKSDFHSAGIP
ncbi:hypothetical protein ACFY05_21030 [Microtetraspora fusca]|uniref:Uncharacterized protein n=1 Tax=Microtetraspora fusca TaxID=1997 RepID=A0ABW6VB55_MICFU